MCLDALLLRDFKPQERGNAVNGRLYEFPISLVCVCVVGGKKVSKVSNSVILASLPLPSPAISRSTHLPLSRHLLHFKTVEREWNGGFCVCGDLFSNCKGESPEHNMANQIVGKRMKKDANNVTGSRGALEDV